MNKKILLAIIAIFGMAFGSYSRDTYSRDASILPKAAQTILTDNFKAKVSVIKIDKDFGRVSEYEVVLTDGSEVKFDNNGNWKDVEVAKNHTVPSFFIPKDVSEYIKINHSGEKLVEIENTHGGFELDIANGFELKFNNQGQFVKYD